MFQARIHVESIIHSLRAVGSTILFRTLVGEEPKELPAQAMSLLVLREEPKLLAGTVLSNKGNSFQLSSFPFKLENDIHFVDSQVSIRTIKNHRTPFHYEYFVAFQVVERAITPLCKSLEGLACEGIFHMVVSPRPPRCHC